MSTPQLHSDTLSEPSIHRSFLCHTGSVNSIAFRPIDDPTNSRSRVSQLASGGSDNLVLVWTWHPSLRCYRFVGHRAAVTGVRYSADGNLLASSSKDCTVRIWQPNSEGRSLIIQPHMEAVNSVSWSADGRRILTSSDDGTAKIWRLEAFPDGLNGLPGSGSYESSLVGHTRSVLTAEFAVDGRAAVTGGADSAVKLWDCGKSVCLRTYLDSGGAVRSVAWHPMGNTFASSGDDGAIRIFDSRSHQLIQHYSGHDSAVNSISFHPSGNFLLSSGDDFNSRIWDLRSGSQIFSLHGHESQSPILSAAFSPCGKLFSTGGADQRVNSWFFKSANDVSDENIYRKSFSSEVAISSVAAEPAKFKRTAVKPSKRDLLNQTKPFGKPENFQSVDIQYQKPKLVVRGRNKPAQTKIAGPVRPQTAGPQTTKSFDSLRASDMALPGSDHLESKYDCSYQHSHTGTTGGQRFEYQKEKIQIAQNIEAESKQQFPQSQSHSYPHATTLSSNLRPQIDESHRPAAQPVGRIDAAIGLEGRNRRAVPAAAIVAVRPSDHIARIPDELSLALSNIVTRLDFIGKTLMGFDSRLEMQENKINRFAQLESVQTATKMSEQREQQLK